MHLDTLTAVERERGVSVFLVGRLGGKEYSQALKDTHGVRHSLLEASGNWQPNVHFHIVAQPLPLNTQSVHT